MYSKKPRLLQSRSYNYTAEFRKTRKDKGSRRLRQRLGLSTSKSGRAKKLAGQLLVGAAPIIGGRLLVEGGAVLLGKLRKGRTNIGSVALAPTSTDEKTKLGLQYLKEGSSLGDSPALDTIAGRLGMIKQRVRRGINTYQDVIRLPTTKAKKLLAGLGIAQQVGQDVFRDLKKPVTLRKRT